MIIHLPLLEALARGEKVYVTEVIDPLIGQSILNLLTDSGVSSENAAAILNGIYIGTINGFAMLLPKWVRFFKKRPKRQDAEEMLRPLGMSRADRQLIANQLVDDDAGTRRKTLKAIAEVVTAALVKAARDRLEKQGTALSHDQRNEVKTLINQLEHEKDAEKQTMYWSQIASLLSIET